MTVSSITDSVGPRNSLNSIEQGTWVCIDWFIKYGMVGSYFIVCTCVGIGRFS